MIDDKGIVYDGRGSAYGESTSMADWFDNLFTGNLDYKRQMIAQADTQRYNTAEREASQLFNATEAQKAREWQAQREDTTYQRTVADMRAAGLNPSLLFGNGTGTQAHATSAATSQPASVSTPSVKASGQYVFNAILSLMSTGMSIGAQSIMNDKRIAAMLSKKR